MPQVPDRSTRDQKLAAAIAAAFAAQHQSATQSGSIDWESFRSQIKQAAIANLQPIFLTMGGGLRLLPAGVLLSHSHQWAEQYGQQLADTIAANTQAKVRDAVARAGGDEDKLTEALQAAFSDERAMSIATTEITRTASQGEQLAAAIWTPDQKALTPIWQTAIKNVCDVCDLFDGTSRDVWGPEFPDGPPAHPHCRCYLHWVTE